MELEYKSLVNFGNWGLGDDGMIMQTLDDLQDSDIRLFTETAKNHNQKIQDAKQLGAMAA